MMLWILLSVQLLIVITNAQVFLPENCPKVTLMQNFHVDQFLGKWYEAQKFPTVFEKDLKCGTATLSANADGTVRVENRGINTTDNSPSVALGEAKLLTTANKEGRFSVTFPDIPLDRPVPEEGNYWVLETDYKTYALIYSCQAVAPNISAQLAWILTRSQNPASGLPSNLVQKFNRAGVPVKFFTEMDQSSCQ